MRSDTESQVSARRNPLAIQWVKRELSLNGVSSSIREDLGVQLEEIARWHNQCISNTIHQMGDVKGADSVVQILNGAIEQCKKENYNSSKSMRRRDTTEC